jgi:pimeloyl-ACP methyl ester carboxylesterase
MPPARADLHVIYLHGFASSPASSKAARFARELAARGVGISCPDFNQPAFETLTVTRMLAQTQAAIEAAPAPRVWLIGSSLGGFVALHAAEADRTGRIERLVLLAPALEFGGNRLRRLGDAAVDEWRRSGRLRVFHYGEAAEREVRFDLYEDAARYDAFTLQPSVPVEIWQGSQDTVVDPRMVEAWAAARSGVRLHLLDDDHQLAASMDGIWGGVQKEL